jgi:hypothetical protein
MTRVAQIGALVCLLVFGLFVLGCLSGIGWVRVSPDKRYVTVVVPVSEPVDEDTEWELRVLDLQTRATIPVRRFKMGQDWFAACQWSPDSQNSCSMVKRGGLIHSTSLMWLRVNWSCFQ